jgi:hypothetical protein
MHRSDDLQAHRPLGGKSGWHCQSWTTRQPVLFMRGIGFGGLTSFHGDGDDSADDEFTP